MPHPSAADLELYACQDVTGWNAWKLARHLRNCEQCTAEVKRLQHFWQAVDWELDIPASAWNHLAEEMRANIHVGLSAAECVKPHQHPRLLPMPLIAALASLLVIAAAGAYFQVAQPPAAALTPVLETSRAGIQARDGNDVLEFVNRSERAPIRTVSAGGEMRSRYVDGDSGDVTIVNVYAQ